MDHGIPTTRNYQALLAEIVYGRVLADRELAAMAEQEVQAAASIRPVSEILDRIDDPPEPVELKYPLLKERLKVPGNRRTRINYFELESQNSSLGRAGEEFIVRFEQARLQQLGKDALADRVEHIAVTEGDGAGFDIRSFEPDGTEDLLR